MVWDSIIAGYLFLAGLGAGAFILGALSSWSGKRNGVKPAKLKLAAFIIGPVAVAVGTLLLIVDAKAGAANPLRFFFLVSNLQSVMSWGVIILCLFLLVSVIDLALLIVKKSTPAILDGIGLVLAVCVAAYTGILLGDAGTAFPLWNMAILPLLFVVSALSTGFALVVLITRAIAKEELAAIRFIGKTEIALPLLEALLIIVLLAVSAFSAGSQSAAGAASVSSLISGSYALAFWIGLVAVGLVAPFVLNTVSQKRLHGVESAKEELSSAEAIPSWTPFVASACVIIGGFMLRYLIVMAAVPVGIAS